MSVDLIDRRGLGAKGLLWLTALAMVALALGLVACGGETTSTTAGGPATTAAGSQTVAAGTETTAGGTDELSIVIYGTETQANETLDPNNDMFALNTDHNVYERLTHYDDTTKEIVPCLATSWEVAADGLTWTFHLREGVTFQDGTPFNADAAKFSLDISRAGNLAYLYYAVESVEVVDAMTIAVKTLFPYPVDVLLAGAGSSYMVSPTAVQKYGAKAYDPGNGAGTGPYMLKAVQTTVESTLERNPNYWGGWGGTHANAPDIAIIRQITEPAVRVQNLEQGVVQVISSAPYTDISRLEKNGEFKVWPTPSMTYVAGHLNCKSGPCTDVNLRAALYWAFPYKDVCDMVYGGYATPSVGFIMPPMPGYEEEKAALGIPAQDMAKAKEYLAKSAYPSGDVTIICRVDAASAESVKAMELYKAALAELSITLDVQVLEMSVIGEAASSANPPQDMCVWSLAGGSFGTGTMDLDLNSASTLNFSYWANADVDRLIQEGYAAMATNREAEPGLVVDAMKIILQEYPQINMVDVQTTPVASTELQGFEGFNANYGNMVYFYDVWMEE